MTGNISYLTDFKEHEGGYVAFGRGAKGGKITGKGTIKTGKLDFKDVYFVKELQFNLFSVSQMCDKRNSVLFTYTEYLVPSSNFTLAHESHVLLKVLRKNNMYSFDMKNIVAQKDLTCLLAKATNDESMLWHRRLGIKREYSVAKTPQQNRVAKRRNRTLIEAARTMLADSKLHTTFWAEAVNTACYVQNKVLVVKPHFKTPYEMFRDQLGKFDRKSDEWMFVGYSTISKAFKVYNTRTRKVEENLHITFSKNKPMITGGGPHWLFDIDALSESMNYALVPAGTNSNDFAGKGASFDADLDGRNKDKHGSSQESECDNQERPNAKSSTKNVNTTGPSINTANANDNTRSLNINNVSPPVNNATPTYVDYLSDPPMPDLEDTIIFNDAYDDRDEGAEADYNNLETVISVSPIPSTHVHKDHPKEQTIGETLVDLPHGKRAIGTKWVFRNKRDQRGIVVRNKARLIALGHRQEEGIDYDEVFAPVARIEAIRLFLAYASFMEFTYTSGYEECIFIYRTIEEEVYVRQPPCFMNLEFLDRVYKVEKALYGRHQAPRAWPEIMFVVCACSRFEVQPISHVHTVKRIFRYLRGQPILGLWYPKDSPLELIAYSDSDYAGASLDRKSTTGRCQFLGSRLISLKYKKQTIMANSTTEAEYIAASNCCGHVLWLQNQILDYRYNFMQTKIHVDNKSAICVVKNLVYHSKTKHIEIRHHFIRDSYEKRLIERVKINIDYNVVDLLNKAFDVTRF
nr:putative ribonuclease H-like domain-containing protein [Tanacetum cinerariifolium]